jgi:hypothetical protein
VVPPPACSELA